MKKNKKFDKDLQKKYIESCIAKGFKYEEDAINDRIIVCESIKLSCKKTKENRKKYIYKKDKLEDIYHFLFYVNIPSKNGGVIRFVPAAWQCWVINSIYGVYKKREHFEEDKIDDDILQFQDENIKQNYDLDEERLIQEALIFVARKAGKSYLAGILLLYSFLKGNRSSENYIYGIEKAQSLHLLDYLKDIISISPALKKRIKTLQYKLRTDRNGTCFITPLANNAKNQDGYLPSTVVYDEYAVYPNKSAYEIMISGQGSIPNPLNIFITTANFFTEYPIIDDINLGKKILKGEITNDRKFYAIYELDESDLVNDNYQTNYKNWIKVNPSIGTTVTLERLINMWETAKLSESGKRNFLVKNLNLFIKNSESWLEDKYIKECSKQFNIEDLFGCKAWLGMDLSQTTDLASLVLTIEDKDKLLYQKFFTYFPSEQENKKLRKTQIDLTDWISKGFIQEHHNKTINNDLIYLDILYIIKNFDLQSVVYDPFSAKDIILKLNNEKFNIDNEDAEKIMWLKIKAFPQFVKYFNIPIRFLEKLIYNKEIIFEQNPVFRYNISNIVPFYDFNGYVKFDKNKSKDSIDMAVASAMSIAAYLDTEYSSLNNLVFEQETKEENNLNY